MSSKYLWILFLGWSLAVWAQETVLPPVAVDIVPSSEAYLPDPVPSLPPETPPVGMSPEVREIYSSLVRPEKTPTMLPDGRFVVSSVESFSVTTPISSCSFIARNNLDMLLKTMKVDHPWIAQGDASDLILYGRLNKTLASFSKEEIIPALEKRYRENFETLFDVYRFVPERSYALQSHRTVVFLGDDALWYILDPTDGKKIVAPQLLSEYLLNDVEAEWLLRDPGYSAFRLFSHEELQVSLTFLSPELQFLFGNVSANLVAQSTTLAGVGG